MDEDPKYTPDYGLIQNKKRNTRVLRVALVWRSMPKAGFEPARLAAPPPQDGVSANSTTSANRTYLDFSVAGGVGVDGAAGAGACAGGVVVGAAGVASAGLFSAGGVAGVVVAGTVAGTDAGTTDRLPERPETIVNARDVTMNMIAAAVVAFDNRVAVPRCPNAV